MRVGVTTILVGVLSLAIIAALLALPFAHIESHSVNGAQLRDETVGFQTFHNDRALAQSDGEPVQTAPGTGYLYMLIPAAMVAIAGVLFTLFHLVPGRIAPWCIHVAGWLTGIGAVMVLHANALWAGKGIASVITNGNLGSDAPPRLYRNMIREHSPVDLASAFTPISAYVLVALSIALLAILGLAWAGASLDRRGLRHGARRQAWLMASCGGLLATMLMVPLVMQTLPDGLPANGADRDTYLWSAQDILFLKEVSWEAANEVNEQGLVLWDGLGILLQLSIVVLMMATLGPLIGIAGKHLESLDQTVIGRLLENLSLISVIGGLTAIVAAVLTAFVMADPNDVSGLEATITGMPMIIAAAGLAVTGHGIVVARHVLATESGLVADDFPEPVVYE